MMQGMYFGWPWMISGLLLGLLVIIWLIKIMFPTEEETPLETAKRRYARGEISGEEFEVIKQQLH